MTKLMKRQLMEKAIDGKNNAINHACKPKEVSYGSDSD
jgi:hypothetical protein